MRLWGLMLIALATAQPAWAKMYKWVDEQGKTHYGDTIPAQYAGQGSAEMNKRGMVIKKTDAALTPEQIKERDEAAARQKAEAQKALDAERRDKALLNTYTSEKELDLRMNRDLQASDAIIQTTQVRIKATQAKLDRARKQAAAMTAAKKPVPKDITDEIKEAESELQHLQTSVTTKQQEQAEIRAKFDADKQRFRELKGEAAPTTAASKAPAAAPAAVPAKK